jgi:hypothetical protein
MGTTHREPPEEVSHPNRKVYIISVDGIPVQYRYIANFWHLFRRQLKPILRAHISNQCEIITDAFNMFLPSFWYLSCFITLNFLPCGAQHSENGRLTLCHGRSDVIDKCNLEYLIMSDVLDKCSLDV